MRDLSPMIEQALPSLVKLRHTIHAHPELGFEEHETAGRIVARLEKLAGLSIQTGVAETGIVALLGADKPGPCVALRADMDCLPIVEETGKPYASKSPGRMHACGHDGHVTCLVGAVEVLAGIADELAGPVKFIFQPAEEGGGGGLRMRDAGVLKNPDVAAIFGLHGWPTLEVGRVGVRSGTVMAGTNDFDVTIHGAGAHAAMPHRGIDPVLIGSHTVLALQSIASRFTDPVDSVVVTVARIDGGTATNIIAPTARIRGTIRTLDSKTRDRALKLFEQIVCGTAETFGGRAEVQWNSTYPVLVNDDDAVELVRKATLDALGPHALAPEPPHLGGEDFAFYAEHVPAAFWRLGLRPKGAETYPDLHHPRFDFPDEAIPVGVRMHCEIARRFARDWKGSGTPSG